MPRRYVVILAAGCALLASGAPTFAVSSGASFRLAQADAGADANGADEAAAKAKADDAATLAVVGNIAKLGETDPKGAIALGQQYLQSHVSTYSNAYYFARIYMRMADLQASKLKDQAAAWATVSEGLKSPIGECRQHLLIYWSNCLEKDGRPADSIKFMQDQWDQTAANFDVRCYLLPLYVEVLKRNGKDDAALPLCRSAVIDYPGDVNQIALVQELVKQLMLEGKEDEALSWAKLLFMTCRFDDLNINGSTKLLTETWMAKTMTSAEGLAFLKAQQEAGAPNPLSAIALPQLDAAKLKAALDTLPADAVTQRITVMLSAGEFRAAMLRARGLVVEDPNSNAGVLEVCRVFKARDLSLIRANAFLQYYKTGEGANPVDAFLKENPATGAPAAAAKAN